MSKGWLGVVSAEHVARGVALGITQLNHGKRAPLARLHVGDTLIYYSPTVRRGIPDDYRSFTAIGTVPDDEIWQAEEGAFKPFRRRLAYLPSTHVPVSELRDRLTLTSDPGWGYQLRFGLIELDTHDVEIIRQSMTA